jgi:hypothetical protein
MVACLIERFVYQSFVSGFIPHEHPQTGGTCEWISFLRRNNVAKGTFGVSDDAFTI